MAFIERLNIYLHPILTAIQTISGIIAIVAFLTSSKSKKLLKGIIISVFIASSIFSFINACADSKDNDTKILYINSMNTLAEVHTYVDSIDDTQIEHCYSYGVPFVEELDIIIYEIDKSSKLNDPCICNYIGNGVYEAIVPMKAKEFAINIEGKDYGFYKPESNQIYLYLIIESLFKVTPLEDDISSCFCITSDKDEFYSDAFDDDNYKGLYNNYIYDYNGHNKYNADSRFYGTILFKSIGDYSDIYFKLAAGEYEIFYYNVDKVYNIINVNCDEKISFLD